MRFLSYILLLSVVLFITACGDDEPANNSNTNSGNTSPVSTAPSPAESRQGALTEGIVTPTPIPAVEAVTLKPLIDAFCKARRSKDDAALQKLYTAATVKSLTAEARSEGKKTITEYLESEPVGEKCTVVNERILGETGEAHVITETYPKGIRWTFVKENGDWKLTDQSSDFQKVKTK